MRAPDYFEFTNSPGLVREAMIAATKSVYRKRRAGSSILITVVITILACFGGMAVAVLITNMAGISQTWWMAVGAIAGVAVYLSSNQVLYSELSGLVTKTPLNRAAQSMAFDAQGVTYKAGDAVWSTPWHLVDAVVESKNTLVIVVSGMSFPIPKTAIGDTATVQTLLADLKAQIDGH